MIIRRKKTSPQESIKTETETPKESVQKPVLPNYDILNDIDIDTIAQERFERRRGDRRRGYRRVDDRNLISRAEEEAKILKENAQRDGFNQGLIIAKEQLLSFRTAVEEFMHAKEASVEIIQEDLADLALKIAKKIIKKEASVDKNIVLSIISDVMKEIGKDEKHIIIKIHPDEADEVRMNLPNLFPSLQSEVRMLIEADDTVEMGSCIVETKNGLVDARFSTQLDILQNAFIEKL
jgi:flagellar assembly protein FliH